MVNPEEKLSKRLQKPARWVILGGLGMAVAGYVLGSLTLVAAAFVCSFAAGIIPAEIALRECRRDCESMPPDPVTLEQIMERLEGRGGQGSGEWRHQELVSWPLDSAGHTLH